MTATSGKSADGKSAAAGDDTEPPADEQVSGKCALCDGSGWVQMPGQSKVTACECRKRREAKHRGD